MSAPRIDTFRNTLDAVSELIAELRPDIEDVYELAHNRPKAAAEARVSGGSRDYALDTHGDMHARELYTKVAAEMVGLARGAEKSMRALRRYLNRDDGRPLRLDGSADVSAEEFAQARYARQRRTSRGEHHPHVVVAQPERIAHIDPVSELEHLRAAFRRIAARLDQEHTACRDDDGRRKQKWLDRSILSPAQRDAVDRSLIRDRDAAAS